MRRLLLILPLIFCLLIIPQIALASDWQPYQNGVDGYYIKYPDGWQLDDSQKGIVTRLVARDQKCVIDVFAQPLKGISADEYVLFSNKKILEQKYGVKLVAHNRNPVKGIKAQRLMWVRPQLTNRPNDLNVYREINLIYKQKVYTFTMKTDEANFAQYSPVFDQILQTFMQVKPFEKVEQPPQASSNLNIELKGNKTLVNIPEDKLMFGIFHPLFHPRLYQPKDLVGYQEYEKSLDYKFEMIMTYTEFDKGFPAKMVKDTYADKRIMMLTWHPWQEANIDSVLIPDIVDGKFDSYIADWARQVKDVGEPLFVRFANEMNGDWDPWCTWFFSKDRDLFVESWQRIHRIFREQGADNAIFVWNPHDRSFPDFKWNAPELYYPGDSYVDWIGLTCYNNGTSYPYETWRNFNDMYRPIYDEYMAKYPGKPFMITEFSSNEVGGNKPVWIKDALSSLVNYPNIRIAVWYDQTDGKRLYRIDSTSASKEAFKEGLTNTYYLKDGITEIPEATEAGEKADK